MNRFLNLLNFEINRFSKLYFGLLIITAISQFISIYIVKFAYMKRANNASYASSAKAAQEFISSQGLLNFNAVTNTLFFVAPIFICIALMLLYIFIIWYRDYFGKNTFIYRLFMLPTTRMTIYYAKAFTILLLVLSLSAFQFILLPLEMLVFESIVPSELIGKISVIDFITGTNEFFNLILPSNFVQFLLTYGVCLTAVFVLFTSILFERSYRWKGIVFGILYGIAVVLFLISPILLNELVLKDKGGFSFYPLELFYIELVFLMVVSGVSIFLSNYLLKNKVSV